MMKGNEKDCICDKPNGKHRKHCDAYRLSEFYKKAGSQIRQRIGGRDEDRER